MISSPVFGADGDILFYRQGTGQADWAQPVINASLGYVYLGFAVEPEESTHTADAVICWDRKGDKVWQFNLPDGHRANGGFTMNSAETHLYIGTDTRHANRKNPTAVYCLDAATGVQIWKTDAKKGFPKDVARINSGGALSPDQKVLYIGAGGEVFEGESNDNRFFALDSATGKVLWIYTASHNDRQQRPDLQALPDSATAGNGFWADPAVGPDGTIYAPCFNGILYAFNPDGVIKWKYESFYYDNGKVRSSSFSIWHEIWGGPALNADASVVYVGSNDWFLHAVDTATGKGLWKFEACSNCSSTTETGEIYVNPIVGPDGTIYFDSEDNFSYAVNPNGTLKWRSDAKLTALTGTGELAQEENGQELAFLGSFTMLDDGTLIAGVDTGRSYLALNASDGSLKWISKIVVPWAPGKRPFEIRTEVAIDPVTNNIYGGTGSLGGLVVIEGSSPLNKTAPWPKTQKDNHCSGAFIRKISQPSTTAAMGKKDRQVSVTVKDNCNIKVLSFNIAGDDKNWETRKSACYDIIKTHKPDIIGFQELLPVNLKWALDNFGQLGWYGPTIEGSSKAYPADVEGESCRIMYNTNRFRVDSANSGAFWFSPTPDVSSEGWDDLRYCVYVRLVDKNTGDGIYLYNTHWSFSSQNSRTNAAKIIVDRIRSRAHTQDPFIVTGDFNATNSDAGIKILLKKMTPVVEHRIDWIFAEPDKYQLVSSEIISDINGIPISDHDVLVAQLTITE